MISDAEHAHRLAVVAAALHQARIDLAMNQVAVLIGEDGDPTGYAAYDRLAEALDAPCDSLALLAVVVLLVESGGPEEQARKWVRQLSTVQIPRETGASQ